MKRWLWIAALLVSCGSGDDDDTGSGVDGGPGTKACGVEVDRIADQCTTLTGCGGSSNARAPLCPNCPSEVESQICDRGQCGSVERTGLVNVGFNVTNVGVGGNTYVAMVLDPHTGGGTKVTCAALLSTCTLIDNLALNVVNANLAAPPGGLASGRAYTRTVDAHPGPDRVVYLIVTNDIAGRGDIIAHGCKDGQMVVAGSELQVEVTLVTYDR